MAGFAAVLAGHLGVFDPQPRVGTGRKHVGDVRMTVGAGFVPDVGGAFDLKGNDDCPVGGTGIQQQNQESGANAERCGGQLMRGLQFGYNHDILLLKAGIVLL